MDNKDKVKTILQLRDAREVLEVKDLMLNQITKGTACIINLYNSKIFNEQELIMLKEEILNIISNSEINDMWSDEELDAKLKNTIQYYIDKKYDEIGEVQFRSLMDLLDFNSVDIDVNIANFYLFFQDKVNSILAKKGIDVLNKYSLKHSDYNMSFIVYEDSELYTFDLAWEQIKDGIN